MKSLFRILLVTFLLSSILCIAQEKKIGDEFDGSMASPIHHIKLYDENGLLILPDDFPAMPFSTKESCGGKCHSYDIISNGFHFNLDNPDIKGRNGEPFIYSDASIITNIPMSFRKWKGTFHPSEFGVAPFQFLKRFGPYYTGGDLSELDTLEQPDNFMRWEVSGKMPVNCLICHDADPYYDKAEYAANMRKENFSWAPSASSSLTKFKGNASKMPDNFDPFNTTPLYGIDLRSSYPPSVKYDKNRFDEDGKVFFDITRDIPNERCYFCHSSKSVDSNFDEGWQNNEDVHMSSGLNCVDCHKNGLDHNIIRGNNEELTAVSQKYTCEGCHTETGDLGAPIAKHEGLPTIHFEKLACTVCHTAGIEGDKTTLVKTSKNHFMGMHGSTKHGDQFPHIQNIVLVENEFGKIEPRNLVWPSFWAVESDTSFELLDIKIAEEIIRPALGLKDVYNFGEWPKLSDSLLISVFESLANSSSVNGTPVLITGGKKFKLESGLIESEDNNIGEPYTWPVAHKVKPAAQSLGINGCDDCHSVGSDFFNKLVSVESAVDETEFVSVAKFQNTNTIYQNLFSSTFLFRPFLKWIIIISSGLIVLVLISYGGSVIKNVSSKLEENEGGEDV